MTANESVQCWEWTAHSSIMLITCMHVWSKVVKGIRLQDEYVFFPRTFHLLSWNTLVWCRLGTLLACCAHSLNASRGVSLLTRFLTQREIHSCIMSVLIMTSHGVFYVYPNIWGYMCAVLYKNEWITCPWHIWRLTLSQGNVWLRDKEVACKSLNEALCYYIKLLHAWMTEWHQFTWC